MKILLIPGLGYTDRIYEKLDLPGHDPVLVNWIAPLPKENLGDYAERMLNDFVEVGETFALVGHSMGGMVAQEFAARRPVAKIIIISSRRGDDRLPTFFKVIKWFRLDRIFTRNLCLKTVRYWGKDHGFDSPELITLFKDMLSHASNRYLKWALRHVCTWSGPVLPYGPNAFQLHGSEDKTFPLSCIASPDFVLEGGSHIMVYKRSEEVGKVILDVLGQ